MATTVRLDEVLRSLESQKSYSRAGRLMEGRNAARNVSTFNHATSSMAIDMSKVLSVAEINNGDRQGDAEAMCSSARDHPSVALKSTYITASEKRNLFDDSLQTLIKAPRPVPEYNEGPHSPSRAGDYNSPTRANAINVSAISHSPASEGGALETTAVSPKRMQMVNNSSAFLAVPREKVQRPEPANPPVGHYNPRYTAVDPTGYSCVLPKQLKKRHDRAAATPEPTPTASLSTAQPSPAVPARPGTALDAETPAVTDLNPPGRTARAAATIRQGNSTPTPQPTWPFRSRTVGHTSGGGNEGNRHASPASLASPSRASVGGASIYNEAQITKRQPVLCDMARTQGRKEAPARVSADLVYSPPIQKTIKVANIRLDKITGRQGGAGDRSGGMPRTSGDVDRVQSKLNIDNYAQFKYKKQAVIAEFDKYPSKDVWINSSAAIKMSHNTHQSELPEHTGVTTMESLHRTRDISFNKMVPRKAARPAEGFGLEYDATTDFVAKHIHTTHLGKGPTRDLGPVVSSEASQVMYDANIGPMRKKITQTISFDSYPTREERARAGRTLPTVFHETQSALDPTYDALTLPSTMKPIIKGDPHMSTHASRAKRERALNPPTDTNDLMYSYNVDAFHTPLRKGAVGFNQMVSREKHSGSAFANAMKEMARQ